VLGSATVHVGVHDRHAAGLACRPLLLGSELQLDCHASMNIN
jgi:hypothetical protein